MAPNTSIFLFHSETQFWTLIWHRAGRWKRVNWSWFVMQSSSWFMEPSYGIYIITLEVSQVCLERVNKKPITSRWGHPMGERKLPHRLLGALLCGTDRRKVETSNAQVSWERAHLWDIVVTLVVTTACITIYLFGLLAWNCNNIGTEISFLIPLSPPVIFPLGLYLRGKFSDSYARRLFFKSSCFLSHPGRCEDSRWSTSIAW